MLQITHFFNKKPDFLPFSRRKYRIIVKNILRGVFRGEYLLCALKN